MQIRCFHHNFNPRAPCGARLHVVEGFGVGLRISIHAPRAGRDFSFHGLLGQLSTFQSTRPVRGATKRQANITGNLIHFNPRAPCGARRGFGPLYKSMMIFQSTRPVRGATVFDAIGRAAYEFQSTRPVRGATVSCNVM